MHRNAAVHWNMASCPSPHFVLFPFMSKGHTIPLLHLAQLLSIRDIAVTIFTTPSNSPFILQKLRDTKISVIDLPFPGNIPGLPHGVESTDQLPSMSQFIPFARATKLLQPHYERFLDTLPFITCIISDGFLGWTLESASKHGIPRFVSFGMTCYTMAVNRVVRQEYHNLNCEDIHEPLVLKSFPRIEVLKTDLGQIELYKAGNAWYEFTMEQTKATSNSWGILFNTFYELESTYVHYWNREFKPKAWCLGPLYLADPPRVQPLSKPSWIQWLNRKLLEKHSVLYIAFGTQVDIPPEQLREIAIGLERSNVNFLWLVRSKGLIFDDEFFERVKNRGLVVKEWVDQTEVLGHESVVGFMNHCGWNSVLESICASVPILAWPMMADQFFNAKLVEEELGIGMRICADESSSESDLVKSYRVEKMARDLMLGDKGEEARNKVKEIGEASRRAMEEGGSSKRSLDLLINEVCSMRLR
ncbi:hypothetical protein IFM89_012004 [Coptis chinensis]|uniref:Glycosyltransferase N-terminal domain-containing protein n=1 Tax=Coptis chinensis TaxID=261450 RepID=A0A835IXR7_9MAGN|nr:hypothetical protein IFM89_012004 [Coptis chinensis]